MGWCTRLTAHVLFKILLTVLKMCRYKVLCNKVDIKYKVKCLNEKVIGKIIYVHISRTVIEERKGMPEGCCQLDSRLTVLEEQVENLCCW